MSVWIAGAAAVDAEHEVPARYARELRRADAFIRLAVMAAHAATTGAATELPRDCGIFLGSAFGPMETNFDVLGQVVDGEQTSPTLFSHSVFNAAAGYLARIFDVHGAASTVTDFALPFFHALQQAVVALEGGHLSSCLVLQVECYSSLFHDARQRLAHETRPWPEGACALLLVREARQYPLPALDFRRFTAAPASAPSYLTPRQQLDTGGQTIMLHSPLEAGQRLAALCAAPGRGRTAFSVTTDHARVALTVAAA